MNVYDFDNTIYAGDSTVDFYFFCLKRHPRILLRLPRLAWAGLRYALGRLSLTALKQQMFAFLRDLKDVDAEVKAFWDAHIHKTKKWYLDQKRHDDAIISASPHFLLQEACKRLDIGCLISSRVDKRTGVFTGENCKGQEKVARYREVFGNQGIDRFYSDSLSDQPLADIAAASHLVEGEALRAWPRQCA